MPPGRLPFAPTGFAVDGFSADPDVLPYFGFAVFVSAVGDENTYQLPDLPMEKSVLVALNGDTLSQSVDYNVDPDTGKVVIEAGVLTVGHSLTHGDEIIARWCAKEHLVA